MRTERHRKAWAAGATGVVVAGLIAALAHLGSPAERRLRRLDDERVDRLQSLRDNIDLHVEKQGRLPPDLATIANEPWAYTVSKDPATNMAFVYEPLDDRRYRLCAEFARPSTPPRPDQSRGFWAHPEGRHCYELVGDEAATAGQGAAGK